MPIRKHPDLIAVCLWAVVALLAMVVTDNVVVRTVVVLPLFTILTGHTLLSAIGIVGIPLLEYLVYAAGASIAICLAGGFLLNWIGYLTPLGWAAWLAVATGTATMVALYRRRAPFETVSIVPLGNIRNWHLLVLCLAAIIGYQAYALAVRDEAQQREFKYTDFWMLPGDAASSGGVLIGVKSAETALRNFDIEVRFDGQPVALWRSVSIAPGAVWTRIVTVVPQSELPHKAEAFLYDSTSNSLYRKVSAVIPGT